MKNFLLQNQNVVSSRPASPKLQRGGKLDISESVGVEGIEPSTSFLSGMRSTTELHARIFLFQHRKIG